MKFSQELVDDTILPKMDMSNMSMKNKSKLSKEVGEIITEKLAKTTDVATSATTQTFDIVDDEVTLIMNVVDNDKVELFSFDLYDNFLNEHWGEMNLSREKLKGLAEFILKYLENK